MEANIFLSSQIQIQTWLLKDDANRLTYRFGLFRDIIARNQDIAGGRDERGCQDRDGRRFTCSVGPEKREERTRGHRESNIINSVGFFALLAFYQLFNPDNW